MRPFTYALVCVMLFSPTLAISGTCKIAKNKNRIVVELYDSSKPKRSDRPRESISTNAIGKPSFSVRVRKNENDKKKWLIPSECKRAMERTLTPDQVMLILSAIPPIE
jgi:hypothetical protein